MAYLFALGFISILGQVVLLRELSVASYGIELVYTLALGIWLLSTACGTALARAGTSGPSLSKINLFFLLFSAGLPLDIAFIRSIRILLADLPSAYLPLSIQIAAICFSLLPIGAILGLLFRWTAGIFIHQGKTLAGAYAVESIGGLAGGLCATALLRFGFQNFVLGLICALLAAASSALDFDGRSSGKLRVVSLFIVSVLLIFVWKAPVLDTWMTSWTHPNLVETRDSPYSRITVSFLDGQVSVFENDALLFDTESTRAEEFVQLAALQHPNPVSVLILGGGVEGTVHQILMHSPRIVDYVEINPTLLDLVSKNLPPDVQKSLRANTVRIIEADPRQFLKHALTYDLILVGMPEPGSGQANRFYTQEFFQECAARLNRNGILAFRLASSENLWNPHLTRRMVSIYRAAKTAFPEILFLPGSTNVIIGANHALNKDPVELAARLRERNIQPRIVSPAYLRYLFTNDRLPEITRVLESGSAPLNTDVRPICYQYTVMLWLSKLLPQVKSWDFSFLELRSGWNLLWLLAISVPALFLSSTGWPVRRTLLMGVAGFAGMTLETVLLLHFQTTSGILYQDIGILLTGFMAGLAAGSYGVEKISRNPSRLFGFSLLGLFVLLSGITGWRITSGLSAPFLECLFLLAAAGVLVSGVFAYAGLHGKQDQNRAITPLYAADLAGGCAGSLLASLLLAPAIGLSATSFLMIPLLMISALLI